MHVALKLTKEAFSCFSFNLFTFAFTRAIGFAVQRVFFRDTAGIDRQPSAALRQQQHSGVVIVINNINFIE